MNSLKPSRLGIGIISAGKVGSVLGAALREAGHSIIGVHAVSEASKNRAEALLPVVPILPINEIVERSEVIILAIPDDELAPLVQGLANTGAWQQGQIIIHTSGKHGVAVLEPARACGAICLAIHPAMSFTGFSLDLDRLKNTSCAVTGPAPFLPIAQALTVEIGAEPVIIAEGDRALYHSALAHASNHLVTITGQSLQILESLGIEKPAQYIEPLLRASLDNVLAAGENALTGPVVRGDSATVKDHVEQLRSFAEEENAEDISLAYLALARATAQRAYLRGAIGQEQLEKIIAALES